MNRHNALIFLMLGLGACAANNTTTPLSIDLEPDTPLPDRVKAYIEACNNERPEGCLSAAAYFADRKECGLNTEQRPCTARFLTRKEDDEARGLGGIQYFGPGRVRPPRGIPAELRPLAERDQDESEQEARRRQEAKQNALLYYQQAHALYQKACTQQEVEACFILSVLHEKGWGVPADDAQSAHFTQTGVDIMEQRCRAKDKTACDNLADMYRFGQHVRPDANRELLFNHLTCGAGEDYKCRTLMGEYTSIKPFYTATLKPLKDDELQSPFAALGNPFGGPDPRLIKATQRACKKGNGFACLEAGYLLFQEHLTISGMEGLWGDVGLEDIEGNGAEKAKKAKKKSPPPKPKPEPPREWETYFKKALPRLTKRCARKDPKACFAVATMHMQGLLPSLDHKQAGKHYQRACDIGSQEACVKMGIDFLQKPDQRHKGMTLLSAACQAPERLGCGVLGVVHRAGLGVPQNNAEACHLETLACQSGQTHVCDITEQMCSAAP